MWSVYIIRSLNDDSYYVGYTSDIEERLRRHNTDISKYKYTSKKKPWFLVHREEFEDKSSAISRERYLKSRKSKRYIENLVRGA